MATTSARFPNNLPTSLSSFIGREHEISELATLLTDHACRLLTLTGAGGCGKTRLSIAVAHALLKTSTFEHGVCFIELAGLDDPILLAQAVATTLGVAEVHGRSFSKTLAQTLQNKRLLLILDNCEHLLPACTDLARMLLDACPQLRILATSRAPLNLQNETIWLVPSLALPDPQRVVRFEQLAQAEAIQLFVARASAALPSFKLIEQNAATVQQICWRLDGVPLAIELAAARVKLLDVEQIAARLDDGLQLLTRGRHVAPRHQTMRAALDWSYRMLSHREQMLFRRLAVFAGSFTLEAVEAICADDDHSAASTPAADFVFAYDALDLLAELVDKSLLLIAEREPQEAVRYRLLEPIRQYALEKLRDANAEAAIRDRHLDHFVGFAEQAEPRLKSAEQLLWLKRLDKEHDNLRSALDWSARAVSRVVAGLRLAKALHLYWQRRGFWSEGRRWLEAAIANHDAYADSSAQGSQLYLARALVAHGWLAYHHGDYAGTSENLERGLTLAQMLDDRITMAFALGLQAQLNSYAGNYAAGLLLSEASVDSARQSGEPWTLAWADHIHGIILYRRDEPAARVVLDESERLFREAGDRRSIAVHLNVLGYITANAGELEAARGLFEEALAIGNELDDKDLQLKELSNLASLAQLQGDTARAAELYMQVLAPARESGTKEMITTALWALGHIRIVQGDLDTADRLLRESLLLAQELDHQYKARMALAGLCRIAAAQGQSVEAARALGAIDALLKTSDTRHDADELALLEQDHAAVRAAMTPQEFEANFAAGHALTLEQAIQEVTRVVREGKAPLPPLASATPTLRLCALGAARVFLGEQALTNWSYARVKELLFYLVAHPARTKAQIGLALWPDASPTQLRNSLSTTLYHLRRALGDAHWIVFEDEQYRFNRALDYRFDVESFESNLTQAGRWQTQTPARAIPFLQEAIQLYQGDFVEDYLEGEWFLLRREELRRKYLDALLNLGRLHFAQGDYVHAAECYRRAIEKDEVLEEAHRELMRCYARLGELGHALQQYQVLEQIMHDELSSRPAPESVALYEQLRQGEPAE